LSLSIGLVDPGEEVNNAVKRELKEETGFTVTKTYETDIPFRVVYCDPWKSNECEVISVVEIDGELVENSSPKQHLDSDENILLEIIDPLDKDTIKKVYELCETKGYELSSSVSKFLVGLSIGLTL